MYRYAYKIKKGWKDVPMCKYKKEEGKRETKHVFHVHAFEHMHIHAYSLQREQVKKKIQKSSL